MTPRELTLLVEAHNDQAGDEAKTRKIETYNLAGAIRAMVLTKHAPSFQRMFPEERREPMSDEAMYQKARALNRMFGGTEVD